VSRQSHLDQRNFLPKNVLLCVVIIIMLMCTRGSAGGSLLYRITPHFHNYVSTLSFATKMENQERSLCYIAVIEKIYPIPKADKICVALIKGWQCVIRINDFQEGDLAIYYTIDSIPDLSDPNTELIASRGGRVKTIKLRGVVSQGLLAPLSWLESRGHDITNLKEGDDVTEQMGVTKYIAAEELDQYLPAGQSLGDDGLRTSFPASVPKSDETRLQNSPHLLDYISDRSIVITRKEDGCSATFVFDRGEFRVCGRNFTWSVPSNSSRNYFAIANKMNLQEKMTALNRNIALQGELVGPKINGNRMRLEEYSLRVFNIWDLENNRYLLWDEVTDICSRLGVETVPVVYRGRAAELDLTVASFLKMADDQSYLKNVLAEGIVVKTDDDIGGRVSFKVISNKYLLKHDM
jgi:RNA ligase (TIGR02306 family)